MNLLPGLSAVRILGTIALILGLIGAGAWLEHGRMQAKLDRAVAEHNQFKGGVEALGREAERRAAIAALNDLKRKERTDEENARRAADHRRLVERLRAEADRSRGGFLSAVADAARSAEEAEKFRAEFERAYRRLVQRVRAIGDEGDAAVRDLDSAKEWAR